MRKLVVAFSGALLCGVSLTGCAATWQGEDVRYKIVEVDNSTPTEMFKLELVGEAPKGVLDLHSLSPRYQTTSDVTGGAEVGDEILCLVDQEKGNAFGNSNVVTHVKTCKKA